MSFKDQDFSQRLGSLGDEAETIFESVYPAGFVRTGLNRPPLNMQQLPPFIRFTPDFLTTRGLVEVQGHGKDGIAKFKVAKLTALSTWHHLFRVDFFLWDKTQRQYGWLRLPDLLKAVTLDMERTFENDGNKYFAFPACELPMSGGWVKHGDALAVTR